jgi:ATP-dependent Clp protease ATP-binding subunit ClpC
MPAGAPAPTGAGQAPPTAEPEPPANPVQALYALRDAARAATERIARPDDLLHVPHFAQLVETLRDGPFEEIDLVHWYDGACPTLAAAAAVALGARGPSEPALDELLGEVQDCDFFTRHFALRVLRERSPERALQGLLARLDGSWDQSWGRRVLGDHLAACLAADPVEPAALAAVIHASPTASPSLVAELVEHRGERGVALAQALRAAPESAPDTADEAGGDPAAAAAPDLELLRSFARVLTPSAAGEGPILDAVTQAQAEAIERALASGRAVAVVGEAGSGKSAAIRALADRRMAAGATVVEAGAIELMAGQKYIGQLEERLQLLFETCRRAGQQLLWIVPDLHELAWAGRHDNNPTSILDHLLPQLEGKALCVVGETRPVEWERTTQQLPASKRGFELLRIGARSDAEALGLARAWLARRGERGPTAGDAELAEALHLARHHLDDTALPGSLLQVLAQAIRGRDEGDAGPLRRNELLAAVGTLTGLPRDVLDDRARLDLAALRSFLEGRVMGQPDAIDALVERVAMLKAGLTDPGRPQGSFLFTGATGTGKTELVRALAAWLFGSPERTIRIDMSELQDGGALDRMLGSSGPHDGAQSLAQRIRQQPFSVVLLDEVEKAHPAIWDLLLAVLDDGRLTDRHGRLADFRHAILIMTSNLGAARARGAGLGFGAEPVDAVLGELQKTFRPEFLNRIDRIVVFRPLGELTMRRILEKELRRALERRGLRSRHWAVEWDGTALDFLLRAGFSSELGARPLRRAIDQHLLAPLARAIVEQSTPEGDQFLFVRSDGRRIEVQFVDPDAPEPAATPPAGAPTDLPTVALDAGGSPAEFALVAERLGALDAKLRSDDWQAHRQRALDATAAADFWTRPERFAVLGTVEQADRIQHGLDAAARLLGRIGGTSPRARYDPGLLRKLAQRLLLLEQAVADLEKGTPGEAFVQVDAVVEPHPGDGAEPSAARIVAMYEAWAAARGMTLEVLERSPASTVLAVGGFGAFSLLAPEHGLHVFEADGARPHETTRHRVRVTVAPQPAEPTRPDTPRGRRATARDALERCRPQPDIVRRYREAPSPLVRDAVRGWRTGRIDRVLGGDFDLIR